ncbi:DUF4274 domain-containing protein [Spirosoma validum]|uniref:DUF4274 domain-containing protein n=1 Tax=Spirosoma validum TaxID=2771355 RepID=A0A927B8V8_9BACT|nr:DUF4274 domain-containing protein [Spirosoma validum]MBD2757894.1 DUF4274 domain-containing protein [Spirosoma validum]
MLKLTQEQIQFIKDKIFDVFYSLSKKQQWEIEKSADENTEILKLRIENVEKLKTAEELHYLIKNWNWDDGDEIPLLILTYPECDRGTALMIYWLNTPDYYARYEKSQDVPSFDIDGYLLYKEAENLLLEGFFKQERIKFNPRSIASWEGFDNEKIPSKLKEPSEGEDFLF